MVSIDKQLTLCTCFYHQFHRVTCRRWKAHFPNFQHILFPTHCRFWWNHRLNRKFDIYEKPQSVKLIQFINSRITLNFTQPQLILVKLLWTVIRYFNLEIRLHLQVRNKENVTWDIPVHNYTWCISWKILISFRRRRSNFAWKRMWYSYVYLFPGCFSKPHKMFNTFPSYSLLNLLLLLSFWVLSIALWVHQIATGIYL